MVYGLEGLEADTQKVTIVKQFIAKQVASNFPEASFSTRYAYHDQANAHMCISTKNGVFYPFYQFYTYKLYSCSTFIHITEIIGTDIYPHVNHI